LVPCLIAATWLAPTARLAVAATPPQAGRDSQNAVEAAELADLARRRFKEGQFAVAAKLYQRCYELAGTPVMLFNVARAHEESGQRDAALQAFAAYLDVSTDAAGREEARAHIELLQRGTQAPAQPVARDRKAQDGVVVTSPSSTRTASGILLIGGAVVAVVGGAIYATGLASDATLQSDLGRRDAAGHVIGVRRADALARIDSIATRETAGAIAGVVGVMGLATGLALYLQTRPGAHAWLVTPAPDGIALAARF